MQEPRESRILVSVIIPTRNRSSLLKEAIESLWAQTLAPKKFEIIIVDNCSTDDTAEMMTQSQAVSPSSLLYYRNESNQGPLASFNTGARLARADILAFTDSDCWVSPDWLDRGIKAFGEDERIAFVAGAIRDKPGQEVKFFSYPNGAKGGENFFYPAGNILFRKSIFWELNGYDLTLFYGEVFGKFILGFGDTDLPWRMKKSGHKYVYKDDVIVYHEVKKVTPSDWLLWPLRMFVIPLLIKKHPELRKKAVSWGPFFYVDNALFYLGLAGLILAMAVDPWFGVLGFPYVYRTARVAGRKFSLTRLPRVVGQLVFLSLRQVVICGSLLYGSIRARVVIL